MCTINKLKSIPSPLSVDDGIKLIKEAKKRKRRKELEDAILYECGADDHGQVFADKLIKAVEAKKIPYLKVIWAER